MEGLRALRPKGGPAWGSQVAGLIFKYSEHYNGRDDVVLRFVNVLDYWERYPRKRPKPLGAYAALRNQLRLGLAHGENGDWSAPTRQRFTKYSAF